MSDNRKVIMVYTREDSNGQATTFELGAPEILTQEKVTSIEEVTENMGTYGIKWFIAMNAEGNPISKLNALMVEEVIYGPIGEE